MNAIWTLRILLCRTKFGTKYYIYNKTFPFPMLLYSCSAVVYLVEVKIMLSHVGNKLNAFLHPFSFIRENTATKILKLTRILIILSLLSIFIWWGEKSVRKYSSQPLSTDISFSYGDQHNPIQFPLIALCEYGFPAHNPIINKCSNYSHNFYASNPWLSKR